MVIPVRKGIDADAFTRKVARLDRQRETILRRLPDPTDSGGGAQIWYRVSPGKLITGTLAIQPGIADDLPSLLSSFAAEIAWPGVPSASNDSAQAAAQQAVAVWTRVWQVPDNADLRILLWWDIAGQFHGSADLCPRTGERRALMSTDELAVLLDRVAVQPVSSTSPHGLVVAGNRAVNANDFTTARDCYERALPHLPHHLELHHNLALALAHLGEWDAGAAMMRQAMALAPQLPAIKMEYLALETDAGIHAVQENDLARAAEHFLRILNLQPDEPTALANLGNLRLREHRYPEARAIFQRFLRFHPDHPAASKIRLALDEIGDGGSEQ